MNAKTRPADSVLLKLQFPFFVYENTVRDGAIAENPGQRIFFVHYGHELGPGLFMVGPCFIGALKIDGNRKNVAIIRPDVCVHLLPHGQLFTTRSP